VRRDARRPAPQEIVDRRGEALPVRPRRGETRHRGAQGVVAHEVIEDDRQPRRQPASAGGESQPHATGVGIELDDRGFRAGLARDLARVPGRELRVLVGIEGVLVHRPARREDGRAACLLAAGQRLQIVVGLFLAHRLSLVHSPEARLGLAPVKLHEVGEKRRHPAILRAGGCFRHGEQALDEGGAFQLLGGRSLGSRGPARTTSGRGLRFRGWFVVSARPGPERRRLDAGLALRAPQPVRQVAVDSQSARL
jgi:hypothetical protein